MPTRSVRLAAVSGIAIASLVGIAFGQLVAFVALASLVFVAVVGRSRRVRGCGAHLMRRRARRRREITRLKQVRRAGCVRVQQYSVLCDLVRGCDERDAQRFDLDGLLDRFALTALAHQRHVKALDLAPGPDLVVPSASRREIRARRLRHREACAAATARLEDALEAIDELVRLIVQRSAASLVEPSIEHEVDRVLTDLDEIDRAHRELAGE